MTDDAGVAERIDAYIDAAADAMSGNLRQMRRVIAEAAPEAVEGFGYGLPAFRYMGLCSTTEPRRSTTHSTAPPNPPGPHCGKTCKALDVSKGTIRFSPDDPFPATLVRKLVEVCVAEVEMAESERQAKARSRRKGASTSTDTRGPTR